MPRHKQSNNRAIVYHAGIRAKSRKQIEMDKKDAINAELPGYVSCLTCHRPIKVRNGKMPGHSPGPRIGGGFNKCVSHVEIALDIELASV